MQNRAPARTDYTNGTTRHGLTAPDSPAMQAAPIPHSDDISPADKRVRCAISSAPGISSLYLNLAEILFKKGSPKKALHALKSAIKTGISGSHLRQMLIRLIYISPDKFRQQSRRALLRCWQQIDANTTAETDIIDSFFINMRIGNYTKAFLMGEKLLDTRSNILGALEFCEPWNNILRSNGEFGNTYPTGLAKAVIPAKLLCWRDFYKVVIPRDSSQNTRQSKRLFANDFKK